MQEDFPIKGHFDLTERRNKTLPMRIEKQKTSRGLKKIKLDLHKLPNDFFQIETNPLFLQKISPSREKIPHDNHISQILIKKKRNIISQEICEEFRETTQFNFQKVHQNVHHPRIPMEKSKSYKEDKLDFKKEEKRQYKSQQRKRSAIKNTITKKSQHKNQQQSEINLNQNGKEKQSFMNCTFNKIFYSEEPPSSPKNKKMKSEQSRIINNEVLLHQPSNYQNKKVKAELVNPFMTEKINFMNKLEKHKFINNLLSKKILISDDFLEMDDRKGASWKSKGITDYNLPQIDSARRNY